MTLHPQKHKKPAPASPERVPHFMAGRIPPPFRFPPLTANFPLCYNVP